MRNTGYVLVIDDDESILELVQTVLGFEGFEIVTARDGRTALELIEQSPPAAILLDLVMPEMDGWEFLKRYHALAEAVGSTATVIAFTGLHDRSQLPAGVEVDDAIFKPFHIDDLVAKLERYVPRRLWELVPA